MKTQDFVGWLDFYLETIGHPKLTDEQLKEIEEMVKPKTKYKLENPDQMEFPWKYESLGESTADLDMKDRFGC